MASFDSTIGIIRSDLRFEAEVKENDSAFTFRITVRGEYDRETPTTPDHLTIYVSTKDQLHALRAALYAALADSYALESQALTILPALTGDVVKDKENTAECIGCQRGYPLNGNFHDYVSMGIPATSICRNLVP